MGTLTLNAPHPWLGKVLAVVCAVLCACSDGPGGERLENVPPNVWLASAPPSGSSSHYRVNMFWGGWDPDGDIAYYEFVITDNDGGIFDPSDTTTSADGVSPWKRVCANDSVFVFTADQMADSSSQEMVTRFERSHTFFIRAVDRQGLASLEPAYRSFTAWTLSPMVRITIPRRHGLTPVLVPPRATFRWQAQDYVQDMEQVQEPDSVRYILKHVEASDFPGAIDFIRNNPNSERWSPWCDYKAPGDSGKAWTSEPIDPGNYVFAVQAKDEAGAVTPTFDEKVNVRRVSVARRSTGPILEVSMPYIGTVRTSIANTPVVIVDLPADVPVRFTWSASAEYYAGTVTGYRYGWDINDLDDPRQWAVDFTPFPPGRDPAASSPAKSFYFGSHTFDVEVEDNIGMVSRVEVKINIIPFTMQKPLLLVDDFNPPAAGLLPTNGLLPNDEEHDAFWDYVLRDVVGFNRIDDAFQIGARRHFSIVDIAKYRSVIWDALGGYDLMFTRPKLFSFVRFRPKGWSPSGGYKIEPNLLQLFLEAGGHLMICGHQPLTQAASTWKKYPIILKYELGAAQDGNYTDQIMSGNATGDESFGYREACVNVLDVAYFDRLGRARGISEGCAVDRMSHLDPRTGGLREMLPLDSRFPRLELRPEVARDGYAYAENVKGLNSEIYNPPYFSFCDVSELQWPRPCLKPVYGHGCLNEASPFYNAPVAVWSSAYAHIKPDIEGGVAARSIYFGVEPFFFKPEQVQEMMEVILFDEWQLQRW